MMYEISAQPPAIADILNQALAREHFSESAMGNIFYHLMQGAYTSTQFSAFLIAMRAKSETPEEIYAAANVIRHLATPVEAKDAIDIVGTGGDNQSSFNISTCAMIIAAAAGAKVAKHGNRAVSSSSGSADVLEAFGVNLELSAANVSTAIEQIGMGFIYAPNFHKAMKHASSARREIGVRTMFNILGPLVNPAKVKNILIGVFNPKLQPVFGEVLQKQKYESAWIVHNAVGVDEIALCAPTSVYALEKGKIRSFTITPEDFGLPYYPIALLKVSSKEDSMALMQDVLNAKTATVRQNAARDTVVANAAAVLVISGAAYDLKAGAEKAKEVIDSGKAADVLKRYVEFSQHCAN